MSGTRSQAVPGVRAAAIRQRLRAKGLILALLAACAVASLYAGNADAEASAPEAVAPATPAAPAVAPATLAATPAPAPADTVVVTGYYFHRTFRCQTCIHMEEVIAGVLSADFSEDLAQGRMRWLPLDYEDEANAALYAGYGLENGPAFVLARRIGQRESGRLVLEKIWELADQPDRLVEHLQAQIRGFLAAPPAVEIPDAPAGPGPNPTQTAPAPAGDAEEQSQ